MPWANISQEAADFYMFFFVRFLFACFRLVLWAILSFAMSKASTQIHVALGNPST